MYFIWLRSFDAVSREGGFTAAARRLNVSQSTITSQVKALEERFGVELFFRNGHTVTHTEVGHGLYALTQDLLGSYDEAVQFLSTTSANQLRISGVTAPSVIELANIFAGRFPNVQLSINVDTGEKVLNDLNEFRTDVAILANLEKPPRFYSVPYRDYRILAFVNKEHAWKNRRIVRIENFTGQTMVLRDQKSKTRQILDTVLAKNKVHPGRILEVNSRETMREAVISGFGIGVVAEHEYIPDRRLQPVRVAQADLRVSFYVTCLMRRRKRPLISAFFNVAAAYRDPR